ncbi:XdhC family protein [Paenibacillus paridis]|uniref:XdhC family protein n=1 Tax=Paenibacillus paridis TaxID=2583376 RepID=UPI0013908F77|nr:XdhC family protein [Paenibacillus paridis]
MDMHEILTAVREENQRAVLATIVCVEGHSYRKAGATMLFIIGGKQIGSISPGCLEHDLMERAEEVWTTGRFSCIDYNMNQDKDVIWGEAIGCGGEIRLLLEPVNECLRAVLLKAKEYNDEGQSVRLTRSWNDHAISYSFTDVTFEEDAPCYTDRHEEGWVRMSMDICPRPRLVLFGAGKDTDALYALVKSIGFHIVIADWRGAICTKERYPDAECIVGTPVEIMEEVCFRPDDYLIVCSHQLQQDREMIRLALPLKLVYIGVMGSKKRIRLLFETFLIPSNVRAPIGLSIGADGPAEIAVSIAAELIAIRAGIKQRSRKEWGRDVDFGPLFGGRAKQAHGNAQAIVRAGDK